MASGYNSRGMKPYYYCFRSTCVAKTALHDYDCWRVYLDDQRYHSFCERFREEPQREMFRSFAVDGIIPPDWPAVFECVVDGKPPFQDLGRKCKNGEFYGAFEYFREKLADSTKWRVHRPPLYPEFVFPWGYTQVEYLKDLERYWENVADVFYMPWPSTRIGQDLPDTARIRRLGEIARQEIDEVARAGGLYLPYVWQDAFLPERTYRP